MAIDYQEGRSQLRVPPSNLDAEESVLGAAMISADAVNAVMDHLEPADFYKPAHQLIFEAIAELFDGNQPVDAITVSDALGRRDQLDRMGGIAYLTGLIDKVPTASNVDYYATIVEDNSLRRRLLAASAGIGGLAFEDAEITELMDQAEQAIFKVAEKRIGDGLVPVRPLLTTTLEQIEELGSRGSEITGIPTGFKDLDRKLAGLHPANLVVIAARPSMGKCLTGDTLIVDPKTGARYAIEQFVADRDLQQRNHLLSLDLSSMKLGAASAIDFIDNGVKETFELRTRLGRKITGTANHPFLTIDGWKHLDELKVGDAIATPRHVDAFGVEALPDAEVALLVEETLDRVPAPVFRLPESQLSDYLRSLMGSAGKIEFTAGSVPLARDLQHLLLRFGTVTALTGSTIHEEEFRDTSESDIVWDTVTAIEPAGVQRVYDLTVPVHHNFVANDVIVHNSALATNIALNVARVGHTVAIFTLEMSRDEVVQRLLCALGRIDSQKLRTGQLAEGQWQRVARAAGELFEAPIYVDDSASLTVTEIRAKCRRLKRQQGLDLVVVDYIQLMTGGNRRTENRQQEIAEISRNLKNLARELHVPIIAVSQLNRALEQRQDKRPMLGDLRECVTADTPIRRADTGATITMGEIVEQGLRDLPVWSLDENMQLVRSTMTEAWSTGIKPVFKITTRSGRILRATGNHPLLTLDGWLPVAALSAGSRLAVPRRLPEPTQVEPMNEDELVLLAHLIGDGSYLKRQPLRYTSADPENLQVVAGAAKRRFGIEAASHPVPGATSMRLPAPYRLARGRRNPICSWLDGLGIFDQRSHQKRLPGRVFRLPAEQLRMFLRHLWATDGSITVRKDGDRCRIYYASNSRGLAEDVNAILLRLDFQPRVTRVPQGKYRAMWNVDVSGRDQQLRFLEEIGIHCARSVEIPRAIAGLERTRGNTNVDTIPRQVWNRVREAMEARGVTSRVMASALDIRYPVHNTFPYSPSRARLAAAAQAVSDPQLTALASSHVLWDTVATIEPDGVEMTFDALVPRTHNFVAGEFLVHNSGAIEQDSDVVLFIYRDEYYHPENPENKGVAEVNVAKHRAGATGRVDMTFLAEFTLFSDLGRDVAV